MEDFKEFEETASSDIEELRQKLESLEANLNFFKDLKMEESAHSGRMDIT